MKKYRVISGSMEPVIKIGDELDLIPATPGNLKKFDIIVFQEGDKYTCHYIWHINQHIDRGLITTRNLDGYLFDDPFYADKIIGKVSNKKLPVWIKLKLLFWIR